MSELMGLDEMLLRKASRPAIFPNKSRCGDYIMELLSQLCHRLPDNARHRADLAQLDPSKILSPDPSKPSKLSSLTFLSLCEGDIAVLKTQFNRLSVCQWDHSSDTSVEEFWIEVSQHRDACDTLDFVELASFILGIIFVPFSNATVERTFSQMKLIKTELRNRMGQELLGSILHV